MTGPIPPMLGIMRNVPQAYVPLDALDDVVFCEGAQGDGAEISLGHGAGIADGEGLASDGSERFPDVDEGPAVLVGFVAKELAFRARHTIENFVGCSVGLVLWNVSAVNGDDWSNKTPRTYMSQHSRVGSIHFLQVWCVLSNFVRDRIWLSTNNMIIYMDIGGTSTDRESVCLRHKPCPNALVSLLLNHVSDLIVYIGFYLLFVIKCLFAQASSTAILDEIESMNVEVKLFRY